MAPSQIPRPTPQPSCPPVARPNQRSRQVWGPLPDLKNFQNIRPRMNVHQEYWLDSNMDRFNHLILFGESQPSNGTVRKVERPDGETRFTVAYGEAPDDELRIMLVCHL